MFNLLYSSSILRHMAEECSPADQARARDLADALQRAAIERLHYRLREAEVDACRCAMRTDYARRAMLAIDQEDADTRAAWSRTLDCAYVHALDDYLHAADRARAIAATLRGHDEH